MKISTILDQIDVGAIALPQFQRGYVWTRDQVRALMGSLYRRYPIGSLLVWVTKTENTNVRGDCHLQPGSIELLLDGQQRITSLYGIVRGSPPKFFEGNSTALTGLYFNLEDEIFEFYSAPKMKDNPMWISVSEVMQRGIGEFITPFTQNPEYTGKIDKYINRLSRLHDICEIDLHVEQVTGEDKTVDVVVDIFNQVNSGGTKLSKGDLALARICAAWPEAREEMRKRINKWASAGYYNFRLEWLLRVMNAILTGEAYFSALRNLDVQTIQTGLNDTEKHIDKILNQISSRLGLDNSSVLGSVYAFPVIARYLENSKGNLHEYHQWDKLLFWYIHTLLWGRYAGSTESVISQDLNILKEADNPLEALVAQLSKARGGDLKLHPNDFNSWSVGSRFYPLLYMMTRVMHARDFGTGIELSNHLLGKFSRLHVHHIFPKALLYAHGYNRPQVNAIANFTFLTQETNLTITDHNPEEYIQHYEEKYPGSIKSHWIPMDPNLWKPENYLEFLEARRVLLAESANQFLDSLYLGSAPVPKQVASVFERQLPLIPGHIDNEMEEGDLKSCNEWMVQNNLPAGEFMFELVETITGEAIAYLDLAWPEGVQKNYSQPVAILINEDQSTHEIANKAGFRCFTSAEEFKLYIMREIIDQPIVNQ